MNPSLLHPPFNLAEFLAGHGFRRVRTGPDIYQHAHVEVEDHAGFLYVRRYASPERRSVTWSAGYSPSTPPELVITAILAAFTPIPVARDDAGTWSVWAAVPLTVGVGLSLDSARAATRWLQARGWPYATHQPDASSPPAGTPASQPHIS